MPSRPSRSKTAIHFIGDISKLYSWESRLNPLLTSCKYGLTDHNSLTIADFLYELWSRKNKEPHTNRWPDLPRPPRILEASHPGRDASGRVPVSAGLRDAFEAAHTLPEVKHDGGHSTIHLRHVLYVIFGGATQRIRREVQQVFGGDEPTIERIFVSVLKLFEASPTNSPSADWREEALAWFRDNWAAAPAKLDEGMVIPSITGDSSTDPRVEDCADFLLDARAFAALVAWKDFNPPVAIGVFGAWGAGKSFFMRLVRDEIDRVAAPSSAPPDTAGANTLVVRHIHFNAWHYAETNLWASLVSHIFETLAEQTQAVTAFDQLWTTQSIELEEAERLLDAEIRLADAEQQHSSAVQDLALARTNHTSQVINLAQVSAGMVLGNSDEFAALKKAMADLGIDELNTKALELNAELQKLATEAGRHALVLAAQQRFFSVFWNRANLNWSLGWLLILALCIFVFPNLVALASLMVTRDSHTLVADLGGVISALGGTLAIAHAWARKTVGVMRSHREAFDKKLTEITVKERDEVEKAKAVVEEQQRKVARAAADLDAASSRVKEASQRLVEDTTLEHVKAFVRERMKEGDYVRHLGTISAVRKDFERLSALLCDSGQRVDSDIAALEGQRADLLARAKSKLTSAKAATFKQRLMRTPATLSKPPAPDTRGKLRIVLYVDDLDRCPPETVVRVLQAINQLLTFRLFVVFVAVDVRWLKRSLALHYQTQFAAEDNPTAVSPGEYLEKIFQIPFWVRTMHAEGVERMIAARIKLGDGSATAPPPTVRGDTVAQPPSPADGPPPQKPEQSGPSLEGAIDPPPSTATPLPVLSLAAMRLTEAEGESLRAMKEILDGLPRRTIRFVNSYGLIKASMTREEREGLEANGHRLLAVALALAIVTEELFPAWATYVETHERNSQPDGLDMPTALELVRKLLAPLGDRIGQPKVAQITQVVEDRLSLVPGSGSPTFGKLVREAARFTFHEREASRFHEDGP